MCDCECVCAMCYVPARCGPCTRVAVVSRASPCWDQRTGSCRRRAAPRETTWRGSRSPAFASLPTPRSSTCSQTTTATDSDSHLNILAVCCSGPAPSVTPVDDGCTGHRVMWNDFREDKRVDESDWQTPPPPHATPILAPARPSRACRTGRAPAPPLPTPACSACPCTAQGRR